MAKEWGAVSVDMVVDLEDTGVAMVVMVVMVEDMAVTEVCMSQKFMVDMAAFIRLLYFRIESIEI